ncbi:MAG: hypothetical protein HZC41_12530 [Chloroflexi bacterium]|nr:hypothetical protein [Chloroflexota bacterium]
MSRLCAILWLLLAALAACGPVAPAADLAPTVLPFPTMTPGRLIRGLLPTVVAPSSNGSSQLANPATAVARASLPTPTPDYAACPAPANPPTPSSYFTGQDIAPGMIEFVSDGGSVAALTALLQDEWAVLGERGQVRNDVDFIGAGAPQLVLVYDSPDGGGTLLILGCANGRYTPLYQATTGAMPEIIAEGDMTYDGRPEMLYSHRQCSADNPDDCAYRTLLLAWSADEGRFVNLLNTTINSLEPPTVSDIDNDRVVEIVVRLTDTGSAATGPLRTGVNIYDWNGQYYALSIVQLDPPRFLIQLVHEADRAFQRSAIETSIALLEQALNDPVPRYWLDDEPTFLKSYILYRLLLLYAYTEQEDKALQTLQLSLNTFPPPDSPVYAALIDAFWNGFQTTNNLHSACQQVQAIISARPEALGLLNRYGSRSPVYTARDLCPF